MIKTIKKRDGSIVNFDRMKIEKAITKTFEEVYGDFDQALPGQISHKVIGKISDTRTTVEYVQDLVEKELMGKFPEAAKAYILYRNKRAKLRDQGWDLGELQKDIYENKYRHEGETFKQFFKRVSGHNTDVEKLIRDKQFLFAGRILAGRNIDRKITLSNCYVLPSPEDNLESIFDTAKYMARTYSYGGGVGIDISNLRPEGAKVNNAAKTSTGPVSFMEMYDVTTGVIGQKQRRGALMVSMCSDHKDIVKFINAKKEIDNINNANISIRAKSDLFENEDNAHILHAIATNNWETGEPGMLFWDRVEDWHLLSKHPLYRLVATNPCGEVPLDAWGNCLLGSLVVSSFVKKPFTSEAYIDYQELEQAIKISVTGMNEVLHESIPLHPLEGQREAANNYRQIGLGIMGLADMFIKMGITYGSKESLELSDKLGSLILNKAIEQSAHLTEKYGTYPAYDLETIKQSSFFKALPTKTQKIIENKGMANSHVLSIAPTGSISTMLGISGGIEPIFAKSYTRTTKSLATEGDIEYKIYTEVIEELMEKKNIQKEKDLPAYVVTSHEIDPLDRIKVQSVWQKYVDNAISSTINLKEATSIEEIEELYRQGYNHGLKGMTVFRNNCFRTGILVTEEQEQEQEQEQEHDKIMEEMQICITCD